MNEIKLLTIGHETNPPSFVAPGESSISFAEVGQMNPGSSLLEVKLNQEADNKEREN